MQGQYGIGRIPPVKHTNGNVGQGGNMVVVVGIKVVLEIIIVGTTGGKIL